MSKFVVKNIDCELGVSIEINKVWYRLGAKMGSEANGTTTLADLKTQYDKCWTVLEAEIEQQIKNLA